MSPLRNHTLLESTDFDAFNAAASERFADHCATPTRQRVHHIRGRIAGTQVAPDVLLSFVTYGTEVLVDCANCGALIISLPGTSTIKINVRERQFVKDRDDTLIHSEGSAFSMCLPPSGDLALRINSRALEECAASLLGEQVKAPVRFKPLLSTQTSFGTAFSMQMQLLAESLERRDRQALEPIQGANFQEVLLTELLLSHPNDLSSRLTRPVQSAGSQLVGKAETLIRARMGEPLRIGHVADELNVSLRALFRAFAQYREYSPHKFLEQVRLEEVHRGLTHACPWETVSMVALRHGFSHLGRFAAVYSKRFGEHPSKTLAKAQRSH